VTHAVRVEFYGRSFFIADPDSAGWRKVTVCRGSDRWDHQDLPGVTETRPGRQIVLTPERPTVKDGKQDAKRS
jgi:hypothetical protein